MGGALLRKLDPIYEALVSVMSHFHAVLDYPDEDIDDFSLQNYAALLDMQLTRWSSCFPPASGDKSSGTA